MTEELTASELRDLEELVDEVDRRVRGELRASRWRIVVAYVGITAVFVGGLWSYRVTVDRIQETNHRQAVATCLAMNELRREVIHLGDISGDPRVRSYLEGGLPLDDCSQIP